MTKFFLLMKNSRDIKEKVCHVALNFEEELMNVKLFDYELPDNNHII